jgi:energy-coupling factor transporter ATP-binding protein EcfA2
VRICEPLEFEIPSRGTLVFLGPNAAGKSVLLGSICGLWPHGQVETSWRGALGAPPLLVSQYPETQLFQELVRDELAFAAVSRGVPRAAALDRGLDALERLGFGVRDLERRCWDLSSGERRLIEVVAGLIAPSRLLALDEPSGGLDPARRAALADLIRERADSGPVLVASQDPAWAESLQGEVRTLGQEAEKWLPSLSKKTD